MLQIGDQILTKCAEVREGSDVPHQRGGLTPTNLGHFWAVSKTPYMGAIHKGGGGFQRFPFSAVEDTVGPTAYLPMGAVWALHIRPPRVPTRGYGGVGLIFLAKNRVFFMVSGVLGLKRPKQAHFGPFRAKMGYFG